MCYGHKLCRAAVCFRRSVAADQPPLLHTLPPHTQAANAGSWGATKPHKGLRPRDSNVPVVSQQAAAAAAEKPAAAGRSMSQLLQSRSEAAVSGGKTKKQCVPALPDIDTADAADPLNATDFVADIFSYYKRVEPQLRVAPDYMTRQVGGWDWWVVRRVAELLALRLCLRMCANPYHLLPCCRPTSTTRCGPSSLTGWWTCTSSSRCGSLGRPVPGWRGVWLLTFPRPPSCCALLACPGLLPNLPAGPPSPNPTTLTDACARHTSCLLPLVLRRPPPAAPFLPTRLPSPQLMPETLYLTVNLIDRFLEAKQVTRKHLQLVGVTAMLVASKYEEIWAPEVRWGAACWAEGRAAECLCLSRCLECGPSLAHFSQCSMPAICLSLPACIASHRPLLPSRIALAGAGFCVHLRPRLHPRPDPQHGEDHAQRAALQPHRAQ